MACVITLFIDSLINAYPQNFIIIIAIFLAVDTLLFVIVIYVAFVVYSKNFLFKNSDHRYVKNWMFITFADGCICAGITGAMVIGCGVFPKSIQVIVANITGAIMACGSVLGACNICGGGGCCGCSVLD